ncbi:unnamed protein product [Symbiodinium natans]|uniref:Peptidase A1 domain-containing protein n=1 Tax=Symbiodinium natans TaxID=878477 RepID=A0A812J0U8_9DINO|nr:unnamed protein product [Symbiodinium natans]
MPPHMEVSPYLWQLRGSLSACVPVLLFISSVEGTEVRAATGIEVVNGLEIHAGHAAHHMTALTHRLRRGASRHGASRAALSVDASGSTSGYQLTTPLEDMSSEYTGIIGVGTASDGGAEFEARVVFDTGSTNLWVASVLCKDSPCDREGSEKFYDPVPWAQCRGLVPICRGFLVNIEVARSVI